MVNGVIVSGASMSASELADLPMSAAPPPPMAQLPSGSVSGAATAAAAAAAGTLAQNGEIIAEEEGIAPPAPMEGRAMTLDEARNAAKQQHEEARKQSALSPFGQTQQMTMQQMQMQQAQLNPYFTEKPAKKVKKNADGSSDESDGNDAVYVNADGTTKKKYYRTLKEIEAEPDEAKRAKWTAERNRILDLRKEQRNRRNASLSQNNPEAATPKRRTQAIQTASEKTTLWSVFITFSRIPTTAAPSRSRTE